MSLRLYNTMGRTMQEFKPIEPGKVGFYGCGPTVYNYAHIGNLRAYVFLDVLDKTLTFLGISVLSLVVIGFIVLASAGEQNGWRLYHDSSFFFTRQAIWLGVAFVFLLVSTFRPSLVQHSC